MDEYQSFMATWMCKGINLTHTYMSFMSLVLFPFIIIKCYRMTERYAYTLHTRKCVVQVYSLDSRNIMDGRAKATAIIIIYEFKARRSCSTPLPLLLLQRTRTLSKAFLSVWSHRHRWVQPMAVTLFNAFVCDFTRLLVNTFFFRHTEAKRICIVIYLPLSQPVQNLTLFFFFPTSCFTFVKRKKTWINPCWLV